MCTRKAVSAVALVSAVVVGWVLQHALHRVSAADYYSLALPTVAPASRPGQADGLGQRGYVGPAAAKRWQRSAAADAGPPSDREDPDSVDVEGRSGRGGSVDAPLWRHLDKDAAEADVNVPVDEHHRGAGRPSESREALEDEREREPGPQGAAGLRAGSGITAMYIGVSTVLLDDGETAIMTDGFFTRPSLWQVLGPRGRIGPDRATVERVLERVMRGRTGRLAAVVPVHSHYDHAMDAPLVAQLTGAVVLGSNSTANIARGQGLPEDQIRVVDAAELPATYRFGQFQVTLVRAQHSKNPVWPGEIDAPVVPPAGADAYRMAEAYSVLVRHVGLGRTVLIHGSTNYVAGALAGYQADVVYLASVGLTAWGENAAVAAAFRESYWREVVTAVGARRILPIHWDDFTSPLPLPADAATGDIAAPLHALPAFVDDFPETMRYLLAHGRRDRVDVRFPILFNEVDPFHGLDAAL